MYFVTDRHYGPKSTFTINTFDILIGTLLVNGKPCLNDRWSKSETIGKVRCSNKMITIMGILLLLDHISNNIYDYYFFLALNGLMGHINTIVQCVTLFIQYVLEGANVYHHPGRKCYYIIN